MIGKNKRLLGITAIALIILLVPMVAMLFTEEVNWNKVDFLIAGGMLFGTILLIEIVFRKVKKPNSRVFLFLAVLLVLILVWVELAVGIFGSPLAGS